jgi:hypothetical protein
LTELLPRSGMDASSANVGYLGSATFALFLVGWGQSFLWGPVADGADLRAVHQRRSHPANI